MNRALGALLFLFAISTLISQTLMDIFASLFALIALIESYRNEKFRKVVLTPFGWEKIVLLMLGFFTFSLFLGKDLVVAPAWIKLLDFRWILLSILMGAYLRLHEPDRKYLLILGGFLVFGSLFAILISILGYDPLEPTRAMDVFSDGTVRTGGFHKQPIVFAQLYGIWISFFAGSLAYQIPRFSEFRQDFTYYAVLLATVFSGSLALIFSFTRGVWISVPLSLMVVLLLRRWTWAVAALVVCSSGVFALSLFWPAFETRLLQALQGGDGERLLIWQANFEMFKDHPWFGVGYSHNVELLPIYLKKIGAPAGVLQSHAHNQWLHILVGTGVAGLLFYLSFWFLLLKKTYLLIGNLGQRQRPYLASLTMGCLAAFITFQLGGLFESNYEHSKIRYTLAMITAILIWLEGRGNNSSQVSRLGDKV